MHFSCDSLTVIITLIVTLTAAVIAIILTRRKHITAILLTAALCFTAINATLPLLPMNNVEILLHSDGKNGSVVVISDDISAAVLIGNDKKELNIIRSEILDRNKTASDLTVLCLDDYDDEIIGTASGFHMLYHFATTITVLSADTFHLTVKITRYCSQHLIHR